MSDLCTRLTNEFPQLFRAEEGPFYFEIGPGWEDLIRLFGREMMSLLEQGKIDNLPEVLQIKNKLGRLRINLSEYAPEVSKLVSDLEDQSVITCENTGEPGKIRNLNGWYIVLSDDEYEKSRDRTG